MSGIIPSKKLLIFVGIVSALAFGASQLRQHGQIEPFAALAIAGSLAFANLALGVAGLRTRHWTAWGTYLMVSLAALILLGFASPLTAVTALAPTWIGAAVEFAGQTAQAF